MSFPEDDSYTPQKFTLKSSTGLKHDLVDIKHITLPDAANPRGWIRIPLHDASKRGAQRYLRTSYLQLTVTYMYNNGRDLHMRALRVLAPDEEAAPAPERFMPAWETPAMFASAHIR